MASDTSIPKPSVLWYTYQFLKGLNPSHLPTPTVSLQHKWVLLTGGNSGIGREAALQFARWGANIVLGCRQPPPHEPHADVVVEECKAAALEAVYEGTIVEWWECDMASLESVAAFAKRCLDGKIGEKGLDVLVNNAGLNGMLGKNRMTGDGFEIIHQVGWLVGWLIDILTNCGYY